MYILSISNGLYKYFYSTLKKTNPVLKYSDAFKKFRAFVLNYHCPVNIFLLVSNKNKLPVPQELVYDRGGKEKSETKGEKYSRPLNQN
jgi:hypothetical protein